MLSVTDELKGPGLVFTMLRKCFGEDFDAKRNCSQVAFTKDYRVCRDEMESKREKTLYASKILIRMQYLIYQVNLMKNYKAIGKTVQEFK